MIFSPIQVTPGGKQFQLVKFFAWASFIVLLIFSFPFSMVISQKAKDILMRSYENYALLLGENLSYQVFQNFVIPVNRLFGKIKLSDNEQSELMDRVIKNTIHGLYVDSVHILDIEQGLIAYSTDPSLIGKKFKETEGYRKAVKGELSSGFISSGFELLGLGIEIMGGEKKLKTYIPFKGADAYSGRVVVGGVFELIQDLSKQYESIVKFQYLIFGLSILIMGLIFFALLFIVRKAEMVIDQRAQEQRDLVEQLHQAERLATLGEMVAAVSHEIKNPLGIIQSTSELLGSMPDTGETHRRLSGVIKEEALRLNRIVTEFLDFARPQVPHFQECQLDEIIKKNILFLGPELEKQRITIHNHLGERVIRLMADQDLLYRALLNLFMNAIQSMDNGGTITLRVEEEGDRFYVEIEDTGAGITQGHLKKIFNPFFTTKQKGTGLGLAIVKKIIEGHGGSIDIRSREGKGTKVTLQLPRSH